MRLMEDNLFDTIYHEHIFYFSLTAASHLFECHDLRIFDVEEVNTHGGSLRIYVCHRDAKDKPTGDRVKDLLAREEKSGFRILEHYLSFEEQVKQTKRNLLQFLITAKNEGKCVVAYGAPAKGNTLFNYCGIRSDFVDYTVDRSPHKQGRFLPGTHIPIYIPDKIKETRPDFLLILAWNLKEEVMNQMSFIRQWGGKFVVPLPFVQTYS
jgi:hypothetical protein